MYKKQEKDFKKEEVKQRSWKEIAKELDLENGKVDEKLWNNFKKLLSKRRTKLKEVDISGTAAGPVNKAQKALEELNYITWLVPFVKGRKTKSNLSLAKEGGEKAFDEDQYEGGQNNKDGNNEDESNEGYNDEDQYEANELENPLKKNHGRNCRKARNTISETKIDRKNAKNRTES